MCTKMRHFKIVFFTVASLAVVAVPAFQSCSPVTFDGSRTPAEISGGSGHQPGEVLTRDNGEWYPGVLFNERIAENCAGQDSNIRTAISYHEDSGEFWLVRKDCQDIEPILLADGDVEFLNEGRTEIAYNDIVLIKEKPVGPDPYDANVVLKMRMEGAPTESEIVDEKNHLFTTVGAARLRSGIAAGGNSSLEVAPNTYGTYSGHYIQTPYSQDWNFGTGDFTIEFNVRFKSLNPENIMTFLAVYPVGGAPNSLLLAYGPTASPQPHANKLLLYNSATAFLASESTWQPQLDTWYHIAVVRSGGQLHFFVDGRSLGPPATIAPGTSYGDLDGQPSLTVGNYVGQVGAVRGVNGYLDNIRITKGIARYTANFTPPSDL